MGALGQLFEAMWQSQLPGKASRQFVRRGDSSMGEHARDVEARLAENPMGGAAAELRSANGEPGEGHWPKAASTVAVK